MKFVHIYSEYPVTDEDELRRNTLAQSTWNQKKLIPCPINDRDISTKKFGKQRRPTLKAILDHGLKLHPDEEWFCFSNNDICFLRKDFTKPVEKQFALRMKHQQAFTYTARLIQGPMTGTRTFNTIKDFIPRSHGHDVLFFNRAWWKEIKNKMAGFVVGFPLWDTVFYYLAVTHGLGISTKRDIFETGFYNKQEYNSESQCYTENHFSFWQTPEGQLSPANKHNHQLAKKFFQEEKELLFKEQPEKLKMLIPMKLF